MKNEGILIVDDEDVELKLLLKRFQDNGVSPDTSSTCKNALEKMNRNSYSVVVFDLMLDGEPLGIKLVNRAKEKGIKNIYLISKIDAEDPLWGEVRESGAYLIKKKHLFENSEASRSVMRGIVAKAKQNQKEDIFKEHITTDESERDQIRTVVNSVALLPVFITGPTGSGKSSLAKGLHEVSGVPGEFIEFNCANMAESTLRSEIFGHKKGAFTGATENHQGLLEKANNGTLFLDEVATLTPELQVQLLTAIENKKFYPLGSDKVVESDFRLITATKENVPNLLRAGRIRDDFYHRIMVFMITIKPLSEKRKDISLLIDYFLKKSIFNARFTKDSLEYLCDEYMWPGNVRELKNLIEAFSGSGIGLIKKTHLLRHFSERSTETSERNEMHATFHDYLPLLKKQGLEEVVDSFRSMLVKEAYAYTKEDIKETMTLLGTSKTTLYRILNMKNMGK